jgi:hypothetical protein
MSHSPLTKLSKPAYERYRLDLAEIGRGNLRPGDVFDLRLNILAPFADSLGVGDVVELVGHDFEVEVIIDRHFRGATQLVPKNGDYRRAEASQ